MKMNKRLGFFEFGIEFPLIMSAVILAGSATATTLQLPSLHSKVIIVQSPLIHFAQAAKVSSVTATKIAPLYQSILPAKDNTYSLGSTKFRWKSLQLGPGTLYIQDQLTGKQAGLTVNSGVLLIDGADSLRIGNIQLTATGIKSILSDDDITIGAIGDTGLLSTARGIRFPDGTVQYSASVLTEASTGATGPIGLTGLAGLIGSTGLSGTQGAQGSPGVQGAQGLSGPLGAIGATGAQGATGETGTVGSQGAPGTNGADGVAGTNGADGPRGLTGETGLTGPQGLQGVSGNDGAQGATGPQGPQGIQGATGATGAALEVQGSYASIALFNAAALIGRAGEAWIISDSGDLMVWNINTTSWQSVGKLQGPQGATGPQGSQGLQGIQGIEGVAGTDGLQGPQGIQGEVGATGPQGSAGIDGAQGATGPAGTNGVDGALGATGSQGIQGVTGLTGASVVLGYGTVPSRTVVNYLTVGPANATQANVTVPFPASAASRLIIRVGVAPGAGASYLFTVMNAGVATTITCTIATTATSCSNLVQTSAFAAEADFTIRTTPTGNPTAPVGVSWSIRLTP